MTCKHAHITRLLLRLSCAVLTVLQSCHNCACQVGYDLLVGADGANSVVRHELQRSNPAMQGDASFPCCSLPPCFVTLECFVKVGRSMGRFQCPHRDAMGVSLLKFDA